MKILLFSVLSILFVQIGFAQRPQITESERLMSLGTRPCFVLDIPKTKEGVVEDAWKDYVKEKFDTKLKYEKKFKEYVGKEAKSTAISSDLFTLFSSIEERGDDIALVLWVDMGSGFLNKKDNPDRANDAIGVLRDFYYTLRRLEVGKQLKDQEEVQKDIENKLRKLVKEKEGLEKDIENYKAKIAKAEKDIVDNKKEQETTTKNIEDQKKVVEEVRTKYNNIGKEN